MPLLPAASDATTRTVLMFGTEAEQQASKSIPKVLANAIDEKLVA
jgi:hypothetical protein